MQHTIDEAASLVGRARRSIYRAMDEGRLAYSLRHDGRRTIDTAELLRVYGPFAAPSHTVTAETAQSVTPTEHADLAALIAQAIEPLRLELEQLRQELGQRLAITHQPTEQPAPGRTARSPAPQSFADLLNTLND